MIAANKRLLKANLTQGVLGLQTNLVQLYSNNLSAIATQAALIAGFAFAAIGSQYSLEGAEMEILGYLFYTCFAICLISALFVLSQATITVMFGPSMALQGGTEDAVRIASEYMKEQQNFIFVVGAISVTSLFIGACLLSWALYPVGIASITTFCYFMGYYLLASYGSAAYNTFVPELEAKLLSDGEKKEIDNKNYRNNNKSDDYDSLTQTEKDKQDGKLNPQEIIKMKIRGVLWLRDTVEKGGLFKKVFAVLDKGRLDFYKSEQDYKDHDNPINKKSLKLWTYTVEVDSRKFHHGVTSLTNVMKNAMMGSEDFTYGDLMSKEYDLKNASLHYKFALIPKVTSELLTIEIIEMLAHDDPSYKHWIYSFKTIVNAYDELAEMGVSASDGNKQQQSKQGYDVKTFVKAANV